MKREEWILSFADSVKALRSCGGRFDFKDEILKDLKKGESMYADATVNVDDPANVNESYVRDLVTKRLATGGNKCHIKQVVSDGESANKWVVRLEVVLSKSDILYNIVSIICSVG